MAVIHNHYRALGIDSNASLAVIDRAISKMRQQDTVGNYTAALNDIELTLSDPEMRKKYDDSISLPENERADYEAQKTAYRHRKKKDPSASEEGFLDVRESDARRYQQTQRVIKTYEREELEQQEEVDDHDDLKYPWVFPWKKVFLALLIIGIGAGGFYSSKPLYNEYLTYKQADAALNDLFSARDSVMQYIRENKTFPEEMPPFPTATPSYQILLTNDQHIRLTFNEGAIGKLRGTSYDLEPYEIPNVGLDWRCTIDEQFPVDYKPARCF